MILKGRVMEANKFHGVINAPPMLPPRRHRMSIKVDVRAQGEGGECPRKRRSGDNLPLAQVMPSREAAARDDLENAATATGALRPHIFQATAAAFPVDMAVRIGKKDVLGRDFPCQKLSAIPNLRYRRVMTDNVGRNGPRRFVSAPLRLEGRQWRAASVTESLTDRANTNIKFAIGRRTMSTPDRAQLDRPPSPFNAIADVFVQFAYRVCQTTRTDHREGRSDEKQH